MDSPCSFLGHQSQSRPRSVGWDGQGVLVKGCGDLFLSKTLIPIQPLGLLTTSISLLHYHLKACMKLIDDTRTLPEMR